jgi:hypothetical protein
VHLPRIVGRHRSVAAAPMKPPLSASPAGSYQTRNSRTKRGNGPCVCDEVADNDEAGARANDLDYRRGIGDAVENFCNVAATVDAQDGLRAFIEKRSPNW